MIYVALFRERETIILRQWNKKEKEQVLTFNEETKTGDYHKYLLNIHVISSSFVFEKGSNRFRIRFKQTAQYNSGQIILEILFCLLFVTAKIKLYYSAVTFKLLNKDVS